MKKIATVESAVPQATQDLMGDPSTKTASFPKLSSKEIADLINQNRGVWVGKPLSYNGKEIEGLNMVSLSENYIVAAQRSGMFAILKRWSKVDGYSEFPMLKDDLQKTIRAVF